MVGRLSAERHWHTISHQTDMALSSVMRYNKPVDEFDESTKLMTRTLDIMPMTRYNYVGTRHGYTRF